MTVMIVGKPATHLLLGLQALRVDPPHVVGLRTDVVVPVVFHEVHAGVVRRLCGSHHPQVWFTGLVLAQFSQTNSFFFFF